MTECAKVARHGVKFVGYTAYIVAIAEGDDIHYATVDFVSGGIVLVADDGFVTASNCSELAPFVASLPLHAGRLGYRRF
jgi:hypothetical protein